MWSIVSWRGEVDIIIVIDKDVEEEGTTNTILPLRVLWSVSDLLWKCIMILIYSIKFLYIRWEIFWPSFYKKRSKFPNYNSSLTNPYPKRKSFTRLTRKFLIPLPSMILSSFKYLALIWVCLRSWIPTITYSLMD